MKFGSLFSGIGGFDIGFQRAGMTPAWMCERDKAASAVLARRFDGVRIYDDVRSVGRGAEPADLICGGFPCQDVSVAGKRAGLAGERSGLWFEFHRILSELLPRWVVIENVPGLLSSNGGRDFAVILHGLGELGYFSAWRVLDSQYFGVAQRRRRVFVVGCLGDGRAAEVLFERESVPGHPAPRREARQNAPAVAGTLSANRGGTDRPAGNANELDFCVPVVRPLASSHKRGSGYRNDSDTAENLVAYGGNNTSGPIEVATAQNAHGGTGRIDFESETFITHSLRAEGHDASEDGTGRGTPLVFEPRFARNGRGAPDTIAPPLKAQNGGTGKGDGAPAVIASGVRRLTPTERERLQGFPDGWTDGQADGPRYRQLGNAVTVNVAEWLGRRIMACA